MEFTFGENIIVWQKYNPVELSMIKPQDYLNCSQELMIAIMLGYNPTRIWIRNSWFKVIPLHELYYHKNDDGYYHFIYIQINVNTAEYYIGKVNRKRWSELKRYQGSGLKFQNKYSKRPESFVRYYIATCRSAAETEQLEASIVNDELLKDPLCLNLICGGGGTNSHNNGDAKRQKQRKYMMDHPEQFQPMLQTARRLYCSGNTHALAERSGKIKKTMSAPQYREMTSVRIKKWKTEHPDEYERSRENNRIAQQSELVKEKKKKSRKKWIETHPEEYETQKARTAKYCQTEAAKEKRKKSLIKWNASHPEEAKNNAQKRSIASVQKCQKAVNMIDLQTGAVLRSFESQHAAAEWLVSQGIAKNKNCVSSISAVCLKKPCTTGYGYRKKAYGFGWEFKL